METDELVEYSIIKQDPSTEHHRHGQQHRCVSLMESIRSMRGSVHSALSTTKTLLVAADEQGNDHALWTGRTVPAAMEPCQSHAKKSMKRPLTTTKTTTKTNIRPEPRFRSFWPRFG
jgi:hypothetical protein